MVFRALAAMSFVPGVAERLLPLQLRRRVHGGGPPLHLRDLLPHTSQDRHRHARREDGVCVYNVYVCILYEVLVGTTCCILASTTSIGCPMKSCDGFKP